MFSEAEQRRLAEIEALLRAEDPAFVDHFDTHWAAPRRWRIAAVLGFVASILLTLTALALASVAGAVLGLCGMGAAAGMWHTHRGRPAPDH